METHTTHSAKAVGGYCNFVGNGRGNQRAAYRKRIEAEVQTRYAERLANASGFYRLWLLLKARMAVWHAWMQIGSDDSLYLH